MLNHSPKPGRVGLRVTQEASKRFADLVCGLRKLNPVPRKSSWKPGKTDVTESSRTTNWLLHEHIPNSPPTRPVVGGYVANDVAGSPAGG